MSAIYFDKQLQIHTIQKIIDSHCIDNFFSTHLGNIRRLDLKNVNSDKRMLNITKFIVSLFELKATIQSDITNLTQKSFLISDFSGYDELIFHSTADYRPYLSTNYDHLFIVSNQFPKETKNYKKIFDQALKDQIKINEEDLEIIYTCAWSQYTSEKAFFNTQIADIPYPDYAFKGFCEGYLKKNNVLSHFKLPFKLTQSQAEYLFDCLQNILVTGSLCLSFDKNVSEEIQTKFFTLAKSYGITLKSFKD